MPKSNLPQPSLEDLFDIATTELARSIDKPNILRYGEKEYPEQERFHKSRKRGRFVSGGNRGGKTDAIVVESIWLATDSHPWQRRPEHWGRGPVQLRVVVVDVAKGVEQIMLPKFQRWMTKSMMVDGRWDRSWDAKNLILTFANGSTIDFLTYGMELDKHGGVPRHAVFFDEEPPQNVFNESMMRLIDYNGIWVISATPVKGMGWTYDYLWEPAQDKDNELAQEIDTFVLSAEQNPYVAADEEDRNFYMLGMNKEEREVRESGEFVARSGLVFPLFKQNLDVHVVEPFIPPKDWEWYNSWDFGWNNPTAVYWHAVSPQGDIVTFAEHYASHLTVAEHAEIAKDRERGWGRIPDLRVGDPAGKQTTGVTGTSYLIEYALRDININVEGIPHDVMIGIEKMQSYFQLRNDNLWAKRSGKPSPTWVITSNCPKLIWELKKLRWATAESDKRAYDSNKQEVVHKKDDHGFDSVRYFGTTMPNLAPDLSARLTTEKEPPKTVSYVEMMLRMAEDPDTVYSDDRDEMEWQTTLGYDELYGEAI